MDEIFPLALGSVVRGIGAWGLRTMDQAPKGSPGWRDLVWDSDAGCMQWRFPWSNAAERIEALLWLHRVSGRQRFLQAACHYADCMLENTARGIYRGDDTGDGMTWYWRECDTLMTNYTVRVPPAFFALARATGEGRFKDAALRSGESLLRLQTSIGLFYEGIVPETLSQTRKDEARKWVTTLKINSRIGYVFYTLASLAVETGEPRWSAAFDRFADAFLPLQRSDGSFGEEILVEEKGEYSSQAKGHFHAYILYGMSRALQVTGTNERLLKAARLLADHMLAEIAVSGSHFYGDGRSQNDHEAHEWRTASYEAVAGFAWLYQVDGDTRYRDAARYLVMQAAIRQFPFDAADQNTAGGVIGVSRRDMTLTPFVQGFSNFWLLLGCEPLAGKDWILKNE